MKPKLEDRVFVKDVSHVGQIKKLRRVNGKLMALVMIYDSSRFNINMSNMTFNSEKKFWE